MRVKTHPKGRPLTPAQTTAWLKGYALDLVARTCHEVNRAYCQALGDHSQPPWDKAPLWQKDSAIAGVRMIIEHPSTTPEQSHESWLEQKRRDGWRWGPVKDAEQKTHPCFAPYAELPLEQRVKDYLFGAVVRSLAGITPTS